MGGTESTAVCSEPCDQECSICSELFTDPKLLPCCHLLCRHCLIDLLETQPLAVCPLCRYPIIADPWKAEPKPSSGAIADGFPTDLATVELVEAVRLLDKDRKCCICNTEKVTSLCLDCEDAFCKACKELHTRQKVAMHHKVQDLSTLTAAQLAYHRLSRCPAHADKTCELFCPSHDVSVCHACGASQHRACTNVTDLQTKTLESRATLEKLVNNLRATERELDAATQKLELHVDETEKKVAADLDEMKTVCDRLKSAIDARYQRVKVEAQRELSDVGAKAQTGKGYLLQRRLTMTSLKRVAERTEKALGRDVVNAMTPVLTTIAESLDRSTSVPEAAKTFYAVSITIDHGVVARMEQQLEQELSSLGQVKVIFPDVTPSRSLPSDAITSGASAVITENQLEKFNFHDNHGKNIVISNNNQIAKRTESTHCGGIVMGCLPMTVNCLYQVKIDDTRFDREWTFPVGVVTEAPSTLTVPDRSDAWSVAVVVWTNGVFVNGRCDGSIKTGRQLRDLAVNDRVGLLIDEERSLHLYINRVDQGVAATDVGHPSYPFFELRGQYSQITALPVECIT